MKIVSLLTDFGLNNNFAGLIKTVMLKINPAIKEVIISKNRRKDE